MANEKNIELAVAALEKMHGKNCVMQLGKKNIVPVNVISTGVLSIDRALVVGGFARGRASEVYGPESGGKTTLTLQVIAEAQKAGGDALFVDAEHALDLKYAAALGVDTKKLWVSQPDYGEQALEIAEAMIKTAEFDVCVIDSVAAMVPKAELEGEFGQAHMALQARMMSQAMRKLTGTIARTKTAMIFINQIRENTSGYGAHEVTSGGRALKFYCSQRVEVRRIGAVKDGETITGAMTKVKVVKNKLGRPFQEAELELMYGKGFSQLHDYLRLAIELNVVEKSGNWTSYKGERMGNGKEGTIEFMGTNPELTAKIAEDVKTKLNQEESK